MNSDVSPLPWMIWQDAAEHRDGQKSSFDDMGAYMMDANGGIVIEGGAQDEQGGAVGVLRQVDAEFIRDATELFADLDMPPAELRAFLHTASHLLDEFRNVLFRTSGLGPYGWNLESEVRTARAPLHRMIELECARREADTQGADDENR